MTEDIERNEFKEELPVGGEDQVDGEAEGEEDSTSSASAVRWVVLCAVCIIMSFVYYSLDIPAALHAQLKLEMGEANFELHFNLLYTVYSFPNVALPFIGGTLVDRFGAAFCLSVFAMLCFVGQAVFASGVTLASWEVMLIGRTLYGFGGESTCVAYSTLLTEWFAGKEVALAFGIALAVSRLGSVLNNLVSPVVADGVSIGWALWTGALLNGVSLLTALYLKYLDAKHAPSLKEERITEQHSTRRQEISQEGLSEPLLNQDHHLEIVDGLRDDDSHSGSASHSNRFGVLFWLLSISCFVVYACILPWNNVASGILLERDFFMRPPRDCHLKFPDQCSAGTFQSHPNPSIDEHGNTCPKSHHYAPVLPTSLNLTLDDGTNFQRDFLSENDVDCNENLWARECTSNYCSALQQATETAGRYMSIPYSISACLSPLLGRLVDRIGRRALIASMASFLLVAVHSTLALSQISPTLPLIGQGLAYAFYASVLWPSVTLTVAKERTGTAFGVITSIQNIGLAVFPMVVAAVYDKSQGRYIPNVELIFTSCAVIGSIVGIVLNLVDRRHGNRLNSVDGKGHVVAGEE